MFKNTIKLSLFTLLIVNSFSIQATDCGQVGADGKDCEPDEIIIVEGKKQPTFSPPSFPRTIPRPTTPSTSEPSGGDKKSQTKAQCEAEIDRVISECKVAYGTLTVFTAASCSAFRRVPIYGERLEKACIPTVTSAGLLANEWCAQQGAATKKAKCG